jgi:hypothetical protein
MSPRWEPAFIAVGAIVGESTESLAAALGSAGEAHAADVLRGLRSTSRDVRGRAIAREVSQVALAIEAMRYA